MTRSMRRSSRVVVAGVLVALLATVGLAITAAPAAAHTKLSPHPTCPGSELSPHRHAFPTSTTVTVFVSYSSATGGTNCAWGQKQFSRGTPTSMNLQIARCATGNPSSPCNPQVIDDDPGNFSYYAGPVSVTRTAGKCISLRVRVGSSWTDWHPPIHCG